MSNTFLVQFVSYEQRTSPQKGRMQGELSDLRIHSVNHSLLKKMRKSDTLQMLIRFSYTDNVKNNKKNSREKISFTWEFPISQDWTTVGHFLRNFKKKKRKKFNLWSMFRKKRCCHNKGLNNKTKILPWSWERLEKFWRADFVKTVVVS